MPKKLLPIYPSRSEVYRIIEACPNERDAWLVRLLWYTGGRISEVVEARVGDITAAGIRMLNLKQGVPAQKHVFLPAAFLADLHEWCRGRALTDPIVPNFRAQGRPLGRWMGWYIVKRAGARAGVWKRRFGDDRLRSPWPHSFRHGNAIQLLEGGLPVNAVQAQLGHSTLQSTAVYTQLTDAHRQALVAEVRF